MQMVGICNSFDRHQVAMRTEIKRGKLGVNVNEILLFKIEVLID